MGDSPGDSPSVLAHCAAVERGASARQQRKAVTPRVPAAKAQPLRLGLAQWGLPFEVVQVRVDWLQALRRAQGLALNP